jgi:hypothetical protein
MHGECRIFEENVRSARRFHQISLEWAVDVSIRRLFSSSNDEIGTGLERVQITEKLYSIWWNLTTAWSDAVWSEVYLATERHNPEDDLHSRRRKNLKAYWVSFIDNLLGNRLSVPQVTRISIGRSEGRSIGSPASKAQRLSGGPKTVVTIVLKS